jgi:uncharacterized membrane protein
LAGQPQDPWQSPAQDQARPAWQSYSPPPADNQETYGYPQSGQDAQGAYGQDYSQQGGYSAPAYTVQDPPFDAQEYQEYRRPQGYQQPQQEEQAAPWQTGGGGMSAMAGMTQARPKTRTKDGTKGFFAALFDFSFTSFVTPKIIKVLYVLITVWTVIWALIFLRYGFKYGGAAGGFFTLIVVDPILILITLGAYRMVLELFMVVHRMHEDLKAIRERGDN